jgi:hypothetical protein
MYVCMHVYMPGLTEYTDLAYYNKTFLYCHRHDTSTQAKDKEMTPQAPVIIFRLIKTKSTNKNRTSFMECNNQRQNLYAVRKKRCSLYVPVIRNWKCMMVFATREAVLPNGQASGRSNSRGGRLTASKRAIQHGLSRLMPTRMSARPSSN